MCMGRGMVLVLTSISMVFLMDIWYFRWSAGISNLLAIHSAEEVIASTTTCKGPHCLQMKEQVRSATRPASLHIHLLISSDVNKPYKGLHTYIHAFLKYAGIML